MKLVVGLGNPGRKYQGTRHNVGFVVLERLAERHGGGASSKSKEAGSQRGGSRKKDFQAEVVEISLAGVKSLLIWPQTFMNLSGASVLAARDFYKLADEDLLIVCDDFNLPLGKLRARSGGSSGGQKGLGDIVRRLGSEAIPRLRIGVGPVPDGRDPADFVLGRFTAAEQTEMEITVVRAAEAVETWAREGIQVCMNRFNAMPE